MAHDSHRILGDGSQKGPRVGDLAPNFELRQTFDRSLSLAGLTDEGTVVLCFYVFDFGHV